MVKFSRRLLNVRALGALLVGSLAHQNAAVGAEDGSERRSTTIDDGRRSPS
jgi:hypothetical protein